MQNSAIEWTDHTFNPWWGCQRVSLGCEHCYAETLAHRYNHHVWGPAKTTARREMSANYWRQPIRWNAAAAAVGQRARVFCASMADVFEDHPQVTEWRKRLWAMIEATPHLDWLLLTKRPENVNDMVPWWYIGSQPGYFPDNVWIGTSCEDQKRADERIPHLLRVRARVRFLSCEPLLGPIDLREAAYYTRIGGAISYVNWVIVGGESGHGARPMNPAWVRSLRDQCTENGVAFFFKQWGEYQYGTRRAQSEADGSVTFHDDGMPMYMRAGKKAAGRVLDGVEWNEMPQ